MWCGVVWCDVMWCGVVWCGVVRFLTPILVGKYSAHQSNTESKVLPTPQSFFASCSLSSYLSPPSPLIYLLIRKLNKKIYLVKPKDEWPPMVAGVSMEVAESKSGGGPNGMFFFPSLLLSFLFSPSFSLFFSFLFFFFSLFSFF